jgi:riboflavin synthase
VFTGIIEEIGTVARLTKEGGGIRITVAARSSSGELEINDSVAINGVCQTVIARTDDDFTVLAVEETLKKTTLGFLKAGDALNIELPLRFDSRLGGHLVLGHVDCVGTVTEVKDRESSRLVEVEIPEGFERYLIPVGSIAVDGISLTVATIKKQRFVVSLIPHTIEKTTMSSVHGGTRVNLEFDVIGKYIERLLVSGKGGAPSDSTLTLEKLQSWGYGG